MPQIRKIIQEPLMPQKKRVAAYARVSEERGSISSFEAQVSYYGQLISENPDWEFMGVYADKGISGTRTDNREQFNRLIQHCEEGKIDIILTKSVSRFARNTLDLLQTVRRLREIGIEVRFQCENINTLDKNGELMLTIIASIAQEESRSISENIKWGIRKGFEQGKPNSFVLYGYRMKKGVIEVVPDEAEVVKLIYENYLAGCTAVYTERQLEAMGVKSYYGKKLSKFAIYDMLRQEKYTGNMILQKYYIENHISHRKRKNRGELKMYYVQNSHQPIIDPETFEQVQLLRLKRKERRTV